MTEQQAAELLAAFRAFYLAHLGTAPLPPEALELETRAYKAITAAGGGYEYQDTGH